MERITVAVVIGNPDRTAIRVILSAAKDLARSASLSRRRQPQERLSRFFATAAFAQNDTKNTGAGVTPAAEA